MENRSTLLTYVSHSCARARAGAHRIEDYEKTEKAHIYPPVVESVGSYCQKKGGAARTYEVSVWCGLTTQLSLFFER